MSNLFSEINYTPNDIITVKYVSFKNNLEDISYENLITEFKVNNFVTTFDYLNENNTLTKTLYLINQVLY